jgi:hypothetical protein
VDAVRGEQGAPRYSRFRNKTRPVASVYHWRGDIIVARSAREVHLGPEAREALGIPEGADSDIRLRTSRETLEREARSLLSPQRSDRLAGIEENLAALGIRLRELPQPLP